VGHVANARKYEFGFARITAEETEEKKGDERRRSKELQKKKKNPTRSRGWNARRRAVKLTIRYGTIKSHEPGGEKDFRTCFFF
jgi:hypothetical protein